METLTSSINGDMPGSTDPSSLPAPPNQSSKGPRNLVVCIDGSGDHFGPPDSNTNVVKLFMLLHKGTVEQLCYYQPGIGAGEANGVNSISTAIQKKIDFAIASHLELQVTDAYKWLMDTYEDGDRIYMFGFSRGSYICRALAGMLQRVGLLGAGNFHNVPFAYRIFSKPTTTDNDLIATGFKTTFCRIVHVEFIGVFDTVSSVGLFVPQTLPFTSGNTHIKTFRHAISIDECRVRFQDNLWSANIHVEETVNELEGHVRATNQEDGFKSTDILEIWFPGTHSDIGGGWPDDPVPAGVTSDLPINLSIIPLRWMVREALKAGVLMKPSPLEGLKQDDSVDEVAACATLHNTLPKTSFWWSLELLPTVKTTRTKDGHQKYALTIHMGAPRKIPEGAKLHRSVEVRNKAIGYTPAGGFPIVYDYVD